MKLKDFHSRSLATASTLTGFQVMDSIAPQDVIKILNSQGISFVLVGTYGLTGWTREPRATEDVDLVVATKHLKKACRVLESSFPHLKAEEHEVVIRLRNKTSGDVAVDLLKPNQPLPRAIFKHAVVVRSGKQEYRIPSLEMAVALKFAPMISLTRADEDKYQDAHDFILMVKNNPDIDLEKLGQLGELVYPGGGQEIVAKVQQIRAGKKLQL